MIDLPATPGYDVLAEAREWLAEHDLPEDYADSLSDLLCDAVFHGRWEARTEAVPRCVECGRDGDVRVSADGERRHMICALRASVDAPRAAGGE